MNRKEFSYQLNEELNAMGFPLEDQERIRALSKVLHIKPFQAAGILHGDFLPSADILNKISSELDINTLWLLDKSKH